MKPVIRPDIGYQKGQISGTIRIIQMNNCLCLVDLTEEEIILEQSVEVPTVPVRRAGGGEEQEACPVCMELFNQVYKQVKTSKKSLNSPNKRVKTPKYYAKIKLMSNHKNV